MAQSDETLVQYIKNGNEEAMGELVERWYPRIYAYAVRMTGERQEAQDVTQETFLAVLQSVNAFRPWRQFQSWLFTIAHNKCMDLFRLRGKTLDAPQELERAETQDISGRILDAVAVAQALTLLPPLQREAIVLQYFHDFTPLEIAELTHTPLSTVRWRLTAAKSHLAKRLEEGEHGTF